MNAAAEHYPPREIKQPAGLKKVEICSRSGLLATDKCYDTVKTATGDTVQRRTTYMEIATPAHNADRAVQCPRRTAHAPCP